MSAGRELTTITLGDYIALLQSLANTGVPLDTPVQKWLPARGRHDAPAPGVAFVWEKDVKGVKLHHPLRFWEEHDGADQKGPLVIRV